MTALQPLLYEQAKPDPKLVHEVVMGPFKVKVDDGLNIRKVCYHLRCESAIVWLTAHLSGCIPVHVYPT